MQIEMYHLAGEEAIILSASIAFDQCFAKRAIPIGRQARSGATFIHIH
jgi:hypothetical protein